MPRVYLTEEAAEKARLKDNLKLVENGRSAREMSAIIGVSPATYCKRRKMPETLTAHELSRLCKNAHISIGDFCEKRLHLSGV